MVENLTRLKETQNKINLNADAIDKNKNFVITDTENYYKEKRVDHNVTQCKNCSGEKGICHDGCAYGNGEEKQNCGIMNSSGNCNNCKCHWSSHVNSNIVFVPATRNVTYDVAHLKK